MDMKQNVNSRWYRVRCLRGAIWVSHWCRSCKIHFCLGDDAMWSNQDETD